MYVCICKGITDKQIKAAQAEGYTRFEDIQEYLGVATCCGRCESVAREIVSQAEPVAHFNPADFVAQPSLA